jgi:hypothetical protein
MSAETWVIEYQRGSPPCWILVSAEGTPAFDVTYQIKFAQRFQNREDAQHAMLRLGLSGAWKATRIGFPAQVGRKEES